DDVLRCRALLEGPEQGFERHAGLSDTQAVAGLANGWRFRKDRNRHRRQYTVASTESLVTVLAGRGLEHLRLVVQYRPARTAQDRSDKPTRDKSGPQLDARA